MWCLLTGGEPLLRDDFAEIYLGLKRLGLLVSVFTNACLVTAEHVAAVPQYPPRDIEVSVYGATRETYEAVTRRPGSYARLRPRPGPAARGRRQGAPEGHGAALATSHELAEIARFCRERTKDYYRFDPLLHLRYDGDPLRNAEIRAERLSPEEIVAVEQADAERSAALQKSCGQVAVPDLPGRERPAARPCDRKALVAATSSTAARGYRASASGTTAPSACALP